jgi:hypothetical protein
MKTIRKRLVSTLAIAMIACAAVLPASALDIELGGYFGNLGLPWAGETAMTYDPYPANLWLYGGRAAFVENLGEGFSLRADYETDPVLRHIVKGVVTYEAGIASISAGPMVGVFNSTSTLLKAGIDIGFKLEFPGIAYFSARTDSSMGAGLATPGDYSQEFSELMAGWYVYNAICSVGMTTKRFTRVLDSGDFLVDGMNAYTFSIDVHKKGAPYRVLADLGYQSVTRTYPGAIIDGLGIVVLGAQVSVDVRPSVMVVAGLDSGVYVFGTDELMGRGPAPSSFIFSANLGVTIRLQDSAVEETTQE